MKRFLLVKLEDLSVTQNYEAEEATLFGGPWGAPYLHATMEVPSGVDYRTHDVVEVVLSEGQSEVDIDFDCRHSYNMMMEPTPIVKYFKFVENATLVTEIATSDATAVTKASKDAMALLGNSKKKLADTILAIIAGHNETNGLDTAQIESIKADYPVAMDLLATGMPITAKPLIEAIVPDGVIITQDELDHVALEYAEFELNHPTV